MQTLLWNALKPAERQDEMENHGTVCATRFRRMREDGTVSGAGEGVRLAPDYETPLAGMPLPRR